MFANFCSQIITATRTIKNETLVFFYALQIIIYFGKKLTNLCLFLCEQLNIHITVKNNNSVTMLRVVIKLK